MKPRGWIGGCKCRHCSPTTTKGRSTEEREAIGYEALRDDPEHRGAVRFLNANLVRKAQGPR